MDNKAWDKFYKRQANAAVALIRMGRTEKSWSLLKHSPDPSLRSYLVHRLGPLGVEPGLLIAKLDQESDVSIRRALILSLGEYEEGRLIDRRARSTGRQNCSTCTAMILIPASTERQNGCCVNGGMRIKSKGSTRNWENSLSQR